MSVIILRQLYSLEALVFGPIPQYHSGIIRTLIVVDTDEIVTLALLPSRASRTKFDFSHFVLMGNKLDFVIREKVVDYDNTASGISDDRLGWVEGGVP